MGCFTPRQSGAIDPANILDARYFSDLDLPPEVGDQRHRVAIPVASVTVSADGMATMVLTNEGIASLVEALNLIAARAG
jgi:hypothetical protein